MMYARTTATAKILKLNKRIRGVSGGTGASKTISILIWCIYYAAKNPNITISIVSESFPHLKRGVMRDFLSIMQLHKGFEDPRWNKTDFVYTFANNTKIEFFSADQSFKVRGPRRDVLFINEANNINLEAYNELEVRTNRIIWLDWNPTGEFWWYTDVINHNDVDFITLTYKDNESLPESIVKSIESRKWNKAWWTVYGEGQLGEAEGRIYTGWKMINGIPSDARLLRYGLDFGYTNDPTAIVGIYKYNDYIILDQVCYQKGLSNKQIADILNGIPKALVRADSSEPKSIDELRMYGVQVIGASKGPGSVLSGIQYLQRQKIAITKRSIEGIKEYRNYMWMKDKDGRYINEPVDMLNHFCDSARYGMDDLRLTEMRRGGGVKIKPVKEEVKPWTASVTGSIQGQDFVQGFKDQTNKARPANSAFK